MPGCLQHIAPGLLEPVGHQTVQPTTASHVADQPGEDMVAPQRMQCRGGRVIDQLVPLELVQRREQLAWALGRLVQLDQRLVVKVDRLTEHSQQRQQRRSRLTEPSQGGVEQVAGDLGLALELLDQAGRVGRRAKLIQREPQQHRAADRSIDQTLDQFWGKGLVELVTNVRASAGAVVTAEGRPSSRPSGKLPSCVCSW
ncbi:MAG TPA: hypothetical protein VHS79_15875 [Actinomycetes bacterium]|nr:hypothetical protein [Actinomycetes bacterium]